MSENGEFDEGYNRVVAQYYDATYEYILASGADVAFYAELALEQPERVLELGCGTGRVLLELCQRGVSCVGLDSSRAMLEQLEEKAGSNVPPLVRAQMQDFDLSPHKFGLIYSAFRAFQHLYTIEEQLTCLQAVLGHLKPGGRFAFDVMNPKLDRVGVPSEPERGDVRFERNGNEVVRYIKLERDPVNQLVEASMRFETRREGKLIANEVERVRMRWFTRYELIHLLMRSGFAKVVVYGDFDRSLVGPGSPELVVIGTAPG